MASLDGVPIDLPKSGLTQTEQAHLLALRKALEEAVESVEEVLQYGYKKECQLPNIPCDTTLRHLLEKSMGGVRCEMIEICKSGATSKEAVHRWATHIQAAKCFPVKSNPMGGGGVLG